MFLYFYDCLFILIDCRLVELIVTEHLYNTAWLWKCLPGYRCVEYNLFQSLGYVGKIKNLNCPTLGAINVTAWVKWSRYMLVGCGLARRIGEFFIHLTAHLNLCTFDYFVTVIIVCIKKKRENNKKNLRGNGCIHISALAFQFKINTR